MSTDPSLLTALKKFHKSLSINRNSRGGYILSDSNNLSNPEVQLALQDIREKMLNRNAALSGITLGFVYSTIVELLIALSTAEHHVESDTIYTEEFQTELAKQGSMLKQQFYNFTHNTIDSFKTSLTNQWDTYQRLYGEGRTFQAGFGVGNYVGDVAGYVYVAKGATQSIIRLSLTSYKVGAPIVTKGISATAASLKQAYTSTNEFFAHHTFQNPITLHFDAHRLNCGFPIDSIKFKKPFVAVTPKQHVKYLEKRIGASVFEEHLDYKSGSGGLHGYENFTKAREQGKIRSGIGNDAVPFLQEVGPLKDKVYTGMQSKDGARGWRLDYELGDPNKAVHINWWFTPNVNKPKIRYRGSIKIDQATPDIYWDIISHFPKKDYR